MTGSCAVVVGGSRGIGLGIAKGLSSIGHNVVILSRNATKITQQHQQHQQQDFPYTPFNCDITNYEQLQQTHKQILSSFSKVQVLVNCAGINYDNLLIRSSEEDIRKTIETNLIGTIYSCKVFSRSMIKQKNGCIINIGSVVGHSGNVGQSVYSASKSALIGFTKSLAKEFSSFNIRVNLISPGFIETDMTAQLPQEKRMEIISKILLQRYGTTDEVAQAVNFLVSSTYVTGIDLRVDGGLTL